MSVNLSPSTVQNIAIQSYLFVANIWPHTPRTEEPDRGFQRAFSNYVSQQYLFPSGSAYCTRDFGRGLDTLSKTLHELDLIGWVENNVSVFELKLYEVTDLPKDMILSFYHKVLDFYLKNIKYFRGQEVRLFLPTRYAPIDDTMRMLCFSLGIELIDTELYPIHVIEYYASSMLAGLSNFESNDSKPFEELLIKAQTLVQESSFSMSDFYTLDARNQIVFTPIITSPDLLVRMHRELDAKFRELKTIV